MQRLVHNARPTLLELDVHDASKPRNPWDRLDGETDKAFAAFCVYRDLGPSVRSLRRVAEIRRGGKGGAKAGRKCKHVDRWSSEFRWVERVRAWDIEQDRLLQEAFLAENIRRRREVAEAAQAIQKKALQNIETGDEFNPINGTVAWEKAVKVEFNARGMSSEIVEQRTATVEGPAEFVPKDAAEHYGTMLDIIAGLNLPATHTDPKKDGGSNGEEPTS